MVNQNYHDIWVHGHIKHEAGKKKMQQLWLYLKWSLRWVNTWLLVFREETTLWWGGKKILVGGDSTWRDFFLMDMEGVMSKFLATNGGFPPSQPSKENLGFCLQNIVGKYDWTIWTKNAKLLSFLKFCENLVLLASQEDSQALN